MRAELLDGQRRPERLAALERPAAPARVPGLAGADAAQPGEDRAGGALRHLGPGEQPAAARLHVVRHATRASLRKRAALALAVLAAAGAATAVALAWRAEGGRLAWAGKPLLIRPESLPDDRILTGRVRNTGMREAEVEADGIRVTDAQGRPLQTSARFLSGFVHGLWAPGTEPSEGSEFTRRRLGMLAKLKPDQTAPLTVSWRRSPGAGPAARIDLGTGQSLPLR